MKWLKTTGPFFILALLALWVLIFSIWDIVYEKDWMELIMIAYAIIIVLVLFIIFLRTMRKKTAADTVEEFEKSLKGGLFHFKCPTCNGIFAIKKSRSNDKKPLKMTCPDCGEIGRIPVNPVFIVEEIPEKKSRKVNFMCSNCGEGITVWAEGAELYKDLEIFACPFCGEPKPLNKI